jgi:putative Holliday junction resolvase
MKVLALDIGDSWTGIAISDALRITARPYQTVATENLVDTIAEICAEEPVTTIVIGHPKTMKGTKSSQTLKTEAMAETLKESFPALKWVMWDERLSSKQAASLLRPKNKHEKLETHAVAAALFLMSYLESLKFEQMQ